ATVLTGAGGSPGPVLNLNAEIYYPPYLYRKDGSGLPAKRPTIVSAPASIAVGQTLTATIGATDKIGRVALVRTGTVTHSTNSDQRFVNLPYTQTGSTVTATLPANVNDLPPGYYLLFVFRAGTPSVAKIITVTAT